MGRRHALIGGVFLAILIPPVLAVLGAGVLESGLNAWRGEVLRILSRPTTWRSATFSLGQAAVSAVLAVVVALPGSYILANVRFPGRRLAESLTLLPFVMPGLIVILAVISFYGRAGALNRLLGTDATLVYGPAGIIIAHVMFNVSVALRIIAEGWQSIDSRLREVSRSLGENGVQRFVHLNVPLLTPSVVASLGIIFLYCFVSFGIVLVFGGIQYATLEVRIYQEMFTNLNLSAAGALAMLQLVICGVVLVLLQGHSDRRRTVALSMRKGTLRNWREVPPIARALIATYWALVGLFLVAPLGAILVRSLRPFGADGAWSLSAFRALLTGRAGEREIYEIIRATFLQVVSTSLLIALSAATVTLVTTVAAARTLRGVRAPWLDATMKLPLAISSVTFSLGMRLLWADRLPLLVLLIITQTVTAFPLVFSSVRTTVESLPRRYLESARSLGAGNLTRLRTVELPVMLPGMINAFVFAFALSLADFTTVLTVGRGRIVTFPVAMYRLIGFQSFDVALALGVWYIALVALAFLAIDGTMKNDRTA